MGIPDDFEMSWKVAMVPSMFECCADCGTTLSCLENLGIMIEANAAVKKVPGWIFIPVECSTSRGGNSASLVRSETRLGDQYTRAWIVL